MGFTSLWPLFLLITIPLVVLLYILKRKYKEEVISSTLLWSEVYKNTRANTPWEKFRKNIMLLLQIIIILLLILSLMAPFLRFGGKSYKNIILVIDSTASMNVEYGDGTRLDQSKKLAKELLDSTNKESNTYIINFSGTSTLLQNGDFNKELSKELIDGINKTYNTGDINEITSFVKAIGEGIGEEYEVIVFTDREFSLGDLNGKVISLGNSGVNASIDNISHKFFEDKVKVISTITNRGTGDYEGDFSLYDGDTLVTVEALNLKEGESKTLSFEIPSIKSETLKGELSRKDLLKEDNSYIHVVGNKKINKILLVTEQNLFLEKALSSISNSEIYKTNSVENMSSTDKYDLYVFDGVTPKVMPASGNILFINPSSNTFFKVLKGGEIGEAKSVSGEISSYLGEMSFTVSNYGVIEMPYYGRGFLKVLEDYIGFKGEINNQNIAALTFDLHDSDFVLKKEFPILIYELGESLISRGMVGKSNYKPKDKIIIKSLDANEKVKLNYPSGEVKEIKSGDSINPTDLGIYKAESLEEKELFSVNYPTESESDTKISNIGEIENINSIRNDLKKGFNLTPILIILGILVVAFEWIMYKRGN